MKACFADNGECDALNQRECVDCAFYKTKSRVAKERLETIGKILKLPEEKQIHITNKYFTQRKD